jgi:hypothetical protein
VAALAYGAAGIAMANLAALAAARRTKEHSLGRLRIYASSATHFSITKAAALLGIGRENVQHVAVDEHFKCGWTILPQKSLLTWRPATFHSVSLGMPEPWMPAQSTLYAKFGMSPTGSNFGCTWMEVMARSPS